MGALVRFWAGKIACGLALTVLVANLSSAEEYRTPRAGESFTTELFGQSVTAPFRDRCSVTALNLGVQWLESAPRDYEVLPYGAFFCGATKITAENVCVPYWQACTTKCDIM